MNILKFVCLGLVAMSLGACASVTKGTSHTMVVGSNPQGAACMLSRAGIQIGQVNPTPGQVTVDKSKDDIVVDCTLAGYKPGKHAVASEAEIMTAGNLVFGGLVGLAIDASSGAINKYASNVMVVMQQDPAYVPAPAAAPVAPSASPAAAPVAAPAPTAAAPAPTLKPIPAVGAANAGSSAERPLIQAKTGGRSSTVYQNEKEDRPVSAVERMEQQAGPGYRNYRRNTSSYD